jgi:hypothetical protein
MGSVQQRVTVLSKGLMFPPWIRLHVSCVWMSFHAIVRARCHASAPDSFHVPPCLDNKRRATGSIASCGAFEFVKNVTPSVVAVVRRIEFMSAAWQAGKPALHRWSQSCDASNSCWQLGKPENQRFIGDRSRATHRSMFPRRLLRFSQF